MTEYELHSDFASEVLDESERLPVLVDFWAPWCGPCRVLSPILEKLARESKGAWKLVTVNTDEHPDLAEALRVRGIPTVFLFSGGKPIATFSGARAEKEVREWLGHYVDAAPAPETTAESAQAALLSGRTGEAKKLLARSIEKDPQDSAARFLLARILFPEDIEKAAEIALGVPEEAEGSDAAGAYERLRDLARWQRGKVGREVKGAEADVARYREAVGDMVAGRYEDALEKWLSLVERNRELDDDGARKAMVSLLVVLGEEAPIVREYRRRLTSLLF